MTITLKTSKTRAYKKGHRWGSSNGGSTDNPHAVGTPAHDEWHEGWSDAVDILADEFLAQ